MAESSLDYKSLWESMLTKLAPTIGKSAILAFFKDSIIEDFSEGKLCIAVPTTIGCNFIKDRHQAQLFQVAQEMVEGLHEIQYEVQGGLIDNDHPHKIDIKLFQNLDARKVRKVPLKQEVLVDGFRSKMFHPRYLLQRFIPGMENQLVHAACMAVAAKPGDIYNPLFLYGPVGLGKTHLIQGVGMEILKRFPEKNVVYMTSERFMNEIVDAIGKKNTRSFKERYRKVDCLIVDDVQFFGNKASTQQEFFHTFNELYDAGKQIVLSSDRPPNELDGLEDRLKSRFNMGMVVELLLPDFETRLAILHAKCREYEVVVDPEVLECVAYNVQSSVRELEGVFISAVAEAQLAKTTPTIKSVTQKLRQLYSSEQLSHLSGTSENPPLVRAPHDVIERVAEYFKLTETDLIGEKRKKEFMLPRQICMYLIREVLDHSYEAIGENFGGRNHTTVLHACNKICNRMATDSRIKRDVNALKKEMGVFVTDL